MKILREPQRFATAQRHTWVVPSEAIAVVSLLAVADTQLLPLASCWR